MKEIENNKKKSYKNLKTKILKEEKLRRRNEPNLVKIFQYRKINWHLKIRSYQNSNRIRLMDQSRRVAFGDTWLHLINSKHQSKKLKNSKCNFLENLSLNSEGMLPSGKLSK